MVNNEKRNEKFKSVPFYSLNDKLDAQTVRSQIRFMKKAGMGGFFLHARGGLETEYMSEEWFAAIDAALDEAIKLEMDVWFYDENGWPSGFGDGQLLKDGYYVKYLVGEEKDAFAPDAYACFYGEEGEEVYCTRDMGAGRYFAVYVRENRSYVDLFDPKIARDFIACTHEKYYERYKKYFGNVVKGFFYG